MAESQTAHGGNNRLSGPVVKTLAVVDIGSNSVRLVVYRQDGHYPFPIFNERITVELGRGLDETGKLSEQRIKIALKTLARFGRLLDAMNPTRVKIAATAAVRRAANADEFLIPARKILRHASDVLPASEEARLVTLGLTRNMYAIDGLVVDLGGGSIEMILVKNSQMSHYISLNIGHLSQLSGNEIKKQIRAVDWLAEARGKALYGIGGSFRALGAAFIERTKYPMFLLHGLVIDEEAWRPLLRSMTKSKPNLKGVPAGRQRTMAKAAEIILAVCEHAGADRLFISGTSLRDGLMADIQPVTDKRHDQLIITGRELARKTQRRAGLNAALHELLLPVAHYFRESGQASIDGKKRNLTRLVEAACLLADICWDETPDRRGHLAVERILALPIFSVTHAQRAWLALALYHRYVGLKKNMPRSALFSQILTRNERYSAQAVGLGMRFGQIFCAGIPGYLKLLKLSVSDGQLICTLPEAERQLMDEHSVRRFKQFARSCGLRPVIAIGQMTAVS